MREDVEKIFKAKKIIQKIAEGVNPINGEEIEKNSFLHDPRMIRCFAFIAGVLDDEMERKLYGNRQKPDSFSITPEEKKLIELPDRSIGVNEFARCVNSVINTSRSKKLSGAVINKQLKKMGILSEEITQEGKKRTIVNDKSSNYGIETEKRSFNGNEYDMILFNEKGKKFLLENLESIMSYEE